MTRTGSVFQVIRLIQLVVLCVLCEICGAVSGTMACALAQESSAAGARQIRYQITGLFSPDREQDLHDAMTQLPKIRLVSVDYKRAEAVFEYDPSEAFPDVAADKLIDHFSENLGKISQQTFGIRPLRTIPFEQLQKVEIPVTTMDCKGCSYAAYRIIFQLPGVEIARANFQEGKIEVLIDPSKIDRVALENKLKERGVQIP